jgi:hypothetical protein
MLRHRETTSPAAAAATRTAGIGSLGPDHLRNPATLVCVNETWKLAKARARHRLESRDIRVRGSPPDSDRGLRFRLLTARRAMERPNTGLVFQGRPDIKGGRGIVKHLHLAIFCVACAKCGVLETDCSRTALFRISNSEPTMFEFSHCVCT